MTSAAEAIRALLEDESVTGILVDGPDQVTVERQGKLVDTGVCFRSGQEVIDWANGLLTSHGWAPVGEGKPWTEGRLRDGGRLLVVIPPVAVNGPSVVIRRPFRVPLTFDQLVRYGSVDQTIVDFLNAVMQARLNVIISGGTGSGKTTLASMVVGMVPEEERLVAVERVNELRIQHRHLVHLEAQATSAGGVRVPPHGQLPEKSRRAFPSGNSDDAYSIEKSDSSSRMNGKRSQTANFWVRTHSLGSSEDPTRNSQA